MKKVLFAVFAVAMTMSWPTDANAADNCACAGTDVACVNNCTLSKVNAFKQSVQAKRAELTNSAQAKANAKAKENAKAKAKAEAKAAKAKGAKK